ncbi:chemosensory receptor c [Plakobranchus ocellatus]|uniref:Chemosensory receptor c n=1 Tax=Plakobranchus ocellatus TaxID=259542 RepID=A0AAV4CDP6_9GAST|nr:chemosensory receptor c [Plakobranchus ocellatus]
MLNDSDFNDTAGGAELQPFYHTRLLFVAVLAPVEMAILAFGLASNIINIIVFLKTGVKDNVTTLLLSLSMSDVSYLILMTPMFSTIMIFYLAPDWRWPFDRHFTSNLFYWPAMAVYNFSSFISLFLGLVRCACVAMPLHFKSVFTRSRTVKIVVALLFVSISLHVPVMTVFKIDVRYEPFKNSTSVYSGVTNHLSAMVKINDYLNRICIPWISFIVMIVCAIVLSIKLFQSSRLRSSNKPTSKPGPDLALHENTTNEGKLSDKDIRVVQSVLLVCIIFICSQLVFVITSIVRLINPEFDQERRLKNLFLIATRVSSTFTVLNSSVNIFVYYNYNSKYRAGFLLLFNPHKEAHDKKNYSVKSKRVILSLISA